MNFSPITEKPLAKRTHNTLPAPVRSMGAFGKAARAICLTFDDGPDPVYTPAILEVLAKHNAKATFFVLGEAAEAYPHLIRRIVADGHSLGNHTYSHPHPWLASEARARLEVTRTSCIIQEITGFWPRWFRPPYGRLRFPMRQQALVEGMTTVLWNHSIIDWGVMGNPKGIHQRLNKIAAGDIVLMHDGQRDHNRPDNLLRFLPEFLASLPAKQLYTWSLDGIYYFQPDRYNT
jgi:peptidoglycan/xylan/chitin deacetylase (PgdA/CDA1 family)